MRKAIYSSPFFICSLISLLYSTYIDRVGEEDWGKECENDRHHPLIGEIIAECDGVGENHQCAANDEHEGQDPASSVRCHGPGLASTEKADNISAAIYSSFWQRR